MTNLYVPFQPILTPSGLQQFSLTMQQYPVNTSLRGIVHSYLQISSPKPSIYPIIPDGTQSIFVGQNKTMVSGGITQALELKLPSAGDYFGIRFYPGALRHLFNIHINEMGNQVIDSQFLSSPFMTYLHETIFQHSHFHTRAKVCEQWLLQQLNQRILNGFDEALAHIYRSKGNINVTRDLAKHTGISSRHLHRLFQQHTGLSTKSFAQIIRFQNACRYLFQQPENSLNIALKTGYFDQAHLLNEFKKRIEHSPVAFFNRFMSDFYNRSN